MSQLGTTLQDLLQPPPDAQIRLIQSGVIILLTILTRILLLRIVSSRTSNVRTLYHWRKSTAYLTAFIAILLVGRIWFEGVSAIATFLGLLSAGLVVALRDLIVDIAGWVFIVTRRPFSVGDRVQIGEHAGDVIDQRIFQFTLLEIGRWVDADQSTGRIIHVPNGQIFTTPLANYTKGMQYLWNEIQVRMTFESNWQKAKAILEEIANRHAAHLTPEVEKRVREASQHFMLIYPSLTPRVYTNVKEFGIVLTVRYLCGPRSRRDTAEAIWEDILREFAKHDDIDFAYPTQRIYNRVQERAAAAMASEEAAKALSPLEAPGSTQTSTPPVSAGR